MRLDIQVTSTAGKRPDVDHAVHCSSHELGGRTPAEVVEQVRVEIVRCSQFIVGASSEHACLLQVRLVAVGNAPHTHRAILSARRQQPLLLAVHATRDAVLMRLKLARAARRQVARQVSHVVWHGVGVTMQRRERVEQVLARPLTQLRRDAIAEYTCGEGVTQLERNGAEGRCVGSGLCFTRRLNKT